jgi:thiol:disulfide interchange protein DsbD
MVRWFWSVVVLGLLWVLPAHAQDGSQEFLPADQAFVLSVSKDDGGLLRLNWKISEGYYLYR